MNSIRVFRYIALVEGVSFLVLLAIAMPLKYLFDLPLAVRIVGTLHGVLFLAFMAGLIHLTIERGWPPRRYLSAFVASLLPAGTFFLDRSLKRELEESPPVDPNT